MKYILGLLLIFLLVQCSSAPKVEEKVVINEPLPRPTLKVVRREPGSLWSEDSRWNEIYSVSPARVLGDLVKIKLSPELKMKMARVSEPAKDGASRAAPTNSGGGSKNESEFMEGAITEVLPRGVFAVRALQTVRSGGQDSRFELIGNVREKDIDSTDVVSSDAILNLDIVASVGGGGSQPLDALVAAQELKANPAAPSAATAQTASEVAAASNPTTSGDKK